MICEPCGWEADMQQIELGDRDRMSHNFHDDCTGCDCAHFDVGHGQVNDASQKGAE